MEVQTFSHDVVKELHDGDPAVRVAVEKLGVHSGCEKFSEGRRGEKGREIVTFHYFSLFSKSEFPLYICY